MVEADLADLVRRYVIPLLDGDMDLTRWEEMEVPTPNQDSLAAAQQQK